MPPRASRLAPAALLAVLAAALGPARAAGESVRFGRSDACDAPFAREPASADALQRTAFEWTHEAPLKNWEYAVVNITENGMSNNEWYDWELEAHCGRVTYSSAVCMSAVLQKYTNLGNFRTTIVKVTCVQASSVVLQTCASRTSLSSAACTSRAACALLTASPRRSRTRSSTSRGTCASCGRPPRTS